ASVTPADASEHCKKVYIQVTNNTGAPIKMVDLDYRDYGSRKWRSEPTPNEVIPNGGTWQETRRLEKVNAELTKLRIQFKREKRSGKWHKRENAYSGKATCTRGKIFKVTLR
ncbi:MAG: hypothetical protein ABJN26_24075, partial [Stappiaceae bacterium]